MSVASWERMARELAEDPVMRDLSDEQVEAIVDILALTIHADGRVAPVEVAGFNHLFFDLPWLEGRHELVRAHVPVAAERGAVDGDGDKGLEVARAAAERLEDVKLRERVFQMAVSLASVDMKVAPRENAALGWIATALELDDERREAIIERSRR